MISEKEAQGLIKKILSSSKADEAEVSIDGETTTHLRFARNTPSTSGTSHDIVISVRSTFGTRSGSASINQTDDISLKEVVARSEELAILSPEDPEFLPAPGPQKYPNVTAYFPETAEKGPEVLAAGAEECIKQAESKGLIAAGFLRTDTRFSALGNTSGLFGYQKSTLLSMSETVRTSDGDGSGWVSRASNDAGEINFSQLSRIAVEKAVQSAKPRRLEPGRYVTILEHSCVADLVQSLMYAMDARSADEGRSYFSAKGGGNKVGDRLFPEFVSISSDPTSRLAPGSIWGEAGLPQERVSWIKDGTVENLRYSRFWAQKQERRPVPFPTNIIMNGNKGTVADLIKSTKEGILVTSLWYIRSVDPQSLLLTGLTRDGVFRIENGRIAFPVMNFRWNESPAAMLKNVLDMSEAARVPPRESQNPNIVVPALKVSEFNFSSLSEAV